MQRTLNGALRDSKGSTATFEWGKIPPFVFNPPPLTTALAPLLPSLGCLLAWFAITALVAFASLRRLRA